MFVMVDVYLLFIATKFYINHKKCHLHLSCLFQGCDSLLYHLVENSVSLGLSNTKLVPEMKTFIKKNFYK